MDAIALSMFVEPAVVPSPRGEAPQPDSPFFGAFVAAAANSKEGNIDDSTDTPSDVAASQAGLMSAIVSQLLAQRNSPPSLPPFADGMNQRSSVVPEVAASPHAADEPVLPLEYLPPTTPEDLPQEPIEQIVENAGANRATPDRNPTVSESGAEHQNSAVVTPRVRVGEPRVPIQQLMQHAADIGWSVPNSETSPDPAEIAAAAVAEPVEDTLAKFPLPATARRTNTTFNEQAPETPAHDAGSSAPASETTIGDETKTFNPGQAKTTKTADHPNVPERPGTPQESMRAPELPLQPTPNAQASTASTPSPTTDNIATPPTGNISTAAETSADMPLKLAVATREGQTAEVQTLALHIAARWAKGDSRFTIRLDPPELGRIDVNLNVNSLGHAQAVLAVEKPQTLDLLLRDAPTLERALKDAGLELGGNLSFSLKEEGRQNFAPEDRYSPPSQTIELLPTETAKSHATMNASLVEQLYGLRTARLDITV